MKYKYILEKLSKINPIDEEHGIIDIEYITEKCGNVFQKYDVNFVIFLDLMLNRKQSQPVMWIC